MTPFSVDFRVRLATVESCNNSNTVKIRLEDAHRTTMANRGRPIEWLYYFCSGRHLAATSTSSSFSHHQKVPKIIVKKISLCKSNYHREITLRKKLKINVELEMPATLKRNQTISAVSLLPLLASVYF